MEVDVTGAYSNGSGPASSVTITFYSNRKSRPNLVKKTVTVSCTDNSGSFTCQYFIVKLRPGYYWMSVVANCAFNTCGDWGWTEDTVVHNKPAVWRNPGAGQGYGCTAWNTLKNCFGGSAADFAFDLKGHV
jgi:hypothetical protein